jgi:DNA-binding GntR family transcriptional regulator
MAEETGAGVETLEFSDALAGRSSFPDRIARVLREAIVSGKLGPGGRIVESRIARQLGTGQSTVREALKTLASEGLVVHSPNRGYCVQSLTANEVGQIYELRIEWEPLAVDLAMRNRSDWKAEELTNVVRELKQAAQEGDVEQYYHLDIKFHRTLWKFSGNPFLEKALSQITVPVFAFWMIRQLRSRSLDMVANANTHEKIAIAILAGDRSVARQTTRAALESFWKLVGEADKRSV